MNRFDNPYSAQDKMNALLSENEVGRGKTNLPEKQSATERVLGFFRGFTKKESEALGSKRREESDSYNAKLAKLRKEARATASRPTEEQQDVAAAYLEQLARGDNESLKETPRKVG